MTPSSLMRAMLGRPKEALPGVTPDRPLGAKTEAGGPLSGGGMGGPGMRVSDPGGVSGGGRYSALPSRDHLLAPAATGRGSPAALSDLCEGPPPSSRPAQQPLPSQIIVVQPRRASAESSRGNVPPAPPVPTRVKPSSSPLKTHPVYPDIDPDLAPLKTHPVDLHLDPAAFRSRQQRAPQAPHAEMAPPSGGPPRQGRPGPVKLQGWAAGLVESDAGQPQ